MKRINATSRVLGYRAHQVLEYIQATIRDQGHAPSYTMIRDDLAFNDRAEVCRVVSGLERRGLISRVGNGRVRRIRLVTSNGVRVDNNNQA